MVRRNAREQNFSGGGHTDLVLSSGSQGVKIRGHRFWSGARSGRGTIGSRSYAACRSRPAAGVRDNRRAAATAACARTTKVRGSHADAGAAGFSLRLQRSRLCHLVGRTGAGRQCRRGAAVSACNLHFLSDQRQRRTAVHFASVGHLQSGNAGNQQGAGDPAVSASGFADALPAAAGDHSSAILLDSTADHRLRVRAMLMQLIGDCGAHSQDPPATARSL